MANSRFEYVKGFEQSDALLPRTYVVVRIDGRSFHKFTKEHEYQKPNDPRGLGLMTRCASDIFRLFPDCCFAIGQSDEYSFVLRPSAKLFGRREAKILTTFVSHFTSSFVFHWPELFPSTPLRYPPSFDGRIVLYPTLSVVKDYLAWRQADCHINNLYNTTFWALVQQGCLTPTAAEARLSGTLSADKHELLFSEFGINYNDEEEMYKKGTVIYRGMVEHRFVDARTQEEKVKLKKKVKVCHEDIISSSFWKQEPPVIPDNA